MKSNTIALSPGPFIGAHRALQRIVAGFHWLKIAHAEMRRRARQRAEIAALDAHALRDLGFHDRGALEAFASGAFDAPATIDLHRLREYGS